MLSFNFALKNLSEICGTKDATSNSNANPIAECILTKPVHEISEDVVQTKSGENVCLTALQESDDVSRNLANLEVSANHKTFTNGHLVMNGDVKSDSNQNDVKNMVEEKNEINTCQIIEVNANKKDIVENGDQLPSETNLSNGYHKLACSPMHVHDDSKNSVVLAPVIVKDFEYKQYFNKIESTPFSETNNIDMHEVVENGKNTTDLSNDSNNDTFGMSPELPTIVETVENISASSKSLENKNGEHIFFLLFVESSFCFVFKVVCFCFLVRFFVLLSDLF